MPSSENRNSDKNMSQLVSPDGQPTAAAMATPGCFIHDGVSPSNAPVQPWGKVFADPRKGNKVEFYVTGEEYFNAISSAITTAKESIYITGWQVNFDVELTKGKTLFQYLEEAIDKNSSLRVFIMPWLSPKVGVDTGDFETMMAVFQLNAGLPPPTRAFTLPAIAQSDMTGGLGIGFSHHQKLVIIDNKRAFVGGIDLAYGRRDNGKFSLSHGQRTGNEVYNTCIPPTEELTHMGQTKYLTRAELLAACFDGKFGDSATFITSAPMKEVAGAQDAIGSVTAPIKDTLAKASKWWDTVDLAPEFMDKLKDMPVDAAQDLSRWAYRNLKKDVSEKLDRLRTSGSAHAHDAAAALLAWLNNASMEQLPQELRATTITLIESFMMGTLCYLSNAADKKTTRYANLKKLQKMLPKGAKTFSSSQPRMPWHDVHSSVTGPSVSDLSNNFVLRWNGLAVRYEKSHKQVWANPTLQLIFRTLRLQPNPVIGIPRLAAPPPASAQQVSAKSWVQVLRSAPLSMQKDESGGGAKANVGSTPARAQNNCLKGMLTVIAGAQKFIYIENQFFQTDYGIDATARKELSGPMAALLDLSASPMYEKYARQLEIWGVPPDKILGSIRWSQIDNVKKDAGGRGSDFLYDLNAVMGNIAAVKASRLMGTQQAKLLNPIGEAIAMRIESAIQDGLPFHVYMVLPVHPEGTLNTLNIMTQLHLTMQSLIFGSNSLVNRIRRAILASKFRREKNVSAKQAREMVAKFDVSQLVSQTKAEWTDYLTLLNLRSWEALEKRPVTEQIYVHSKLLIADDRVAILGSANINDRSQLGDRDSELAIMVRDDASTKIKLDGVDLDVVSANVHDLRIRLWKKLFGLTDGAVPATSLSGVLDKPAAKATWRAIQKVANTNAEAYRKSFQYLAAASGDPSSIWPLWNKEKRKLNFQMPFNECFWREEEVKEKFSSWEAKKRAPETTPVGVQGFIVALPVLWTSGENNVSGMNLTMLANVEKPAPGSAFESQEEAYAHNGTPEDDIKATT